VRPLAAVGADDRLLSLRLWCLADWPRRIRAEVLPYDGGYDCDEGLQHLHEAGFIVRQEVAA